MPRLSAGVLLYRQKGGGVEVFLVHPGGPFWAKKDAGAWSIPKGEYSEGEDAWVAAQREFSEETGQELPSGRQVELGEVKYSNKVVTAWAIEADLDPASIKSNTFTIEWPPKSGKKQEFAEVDRAGWFNPKTAKIKLVKGQIELIDRLLGQLGLEENVADDTGQLSLLY